MRFLFVLFAKTPSKCDIIAKEAPDGEETTSKVPKIGKNAVVLSIAQPASSILGLCFFAQKFAKMRRNFMSDARFLSLAQLAAACPFMVM